jgi:hypothetical protein
LEFFGGLIDGFQTKFRESRSALLHDKFSQSSSHAMQSMCLSLTTTFRVTRTQRNFKKDFASAMPGISQRKQRFYACRMYQMLFFTHILKIVIKMRTFPKLIFRGQ